MSRLRLSDKHQRTKGLYMKFTFAKLAVTLMCSLAVSRTALAELVQQKSLDFPIQTEALLKGDIHFYFGILAPGKLAVQYPELMGLDSLSLGQKNQVRMVFSKAVYLVNKPVGFFDDQQLKDERFLAHVMGDQKLKKIGDDAFEIKVPGSDGYRYQMRSFFDSDDVSDLPSSKVTRAVTVARSLDVISKSASTIMFTEKTNYSKYVEGGITVSSFISIKENRTLVITYHLYAVKKAFALPKVLRASFLEETQAVKSLQQDYKH